MPSKLILLLLFGSLTLAAQSTTPTSTTPSVPSVMLECEYNQCTKGGGGAIWVFEGNRGQAMWHYGAIANLTVVSFDGHTIKVHREDPRGSYSSRFAKDGLYTADYTGILNGNRIEGENWYATIDENACAPSQPCPLDVNQILQLGQNSLNAKLYSRALQCFAMASDLGSADGEGLAATMIRDGLGTRANPTWALSLLEDSAAKNSYYGELGLSFTYQDGIGTPKDPVKAAYWKNRADKRVQELEAQQRASMSNASRQQQAIQALMLVMLGAIISDSSTAASPQSEDEKRAMDELQLDMNNRKVANIEAQGHQ